MENVKLERLNHAIQEEISKILMLEVKDEDIKFVTITGCDISNDLSYCKVYFTVLDENKKENIVSDLNNAASFIRGELSKRIDIRHTPELKFIYDTSIEYGNKIDTLMDKIKKEDK